MADAEVIPPLTHFSLLASHFFQAHATLTTLSRPLVISS